MQAREVELPEGGVGDQRGVVDGGVGQVAGVVDVAEGVGACGGVVLQVGGEQGEGELWGEGGEDGGLLGVGLRG